MANYYPPAGFHFVVNVDGFPQDGPDSGFQEVSGLTATVGQSTTHQEGGENRFSHRLPDAASYGDLTLKRGMLVGSQMIQWFRDAVEDFRFDPRDVTVTLLNESHEPLEAWVFVKAWPKSWDISGLSAMGDIMSESIVFSYQYFRRVEVNKNFLFNL